MKKTILSILTLGIFNVTSITLNIPVSALTYSDNIGVDFTFDTSLGVSLSSTSGGSAADLVINNLTPGASSDSNVIDINVISNNLSGYVLNSTVGSSSLYNDNHAIYSTDALIHSTYTSADNTDITTGTYDKPIFTNITADVSSLTVDNTWGYSYSIDGGTTWINQSGTTDGYSGLPLYTSTPAELYFTTGPSASSGDNTYFKIAAKASPTQASGTYNNVINFTVVGNTNPVSFYDAFKEAATQSGSTITQLNGYYKMQDMTLEICDAIEQEESQLALIDIRDYNVYTVAKLKDNRCWMTQNLNLAGGIALSSDATDIDDSYIDNFTTSNNLAKSGSGILLPASSTSGFDNSNYSYIYNSNNKTNSQSDCASDHPCNSYYSWDAATLGSGRSIATDNSDAPYSICPKGWKLPNTRTGTDGSSDFRALMIAYGGSSSAPSYGASTNHNGATMYNNIGPSSSLNLLVAGSYSNSSFNYNGSWVDGGPYGRYWSATSYSTNGSARSVYFGSSYVYSSNPTNRQDGASVRCIASNQ